MNEAGPAEALAASGWPLKTTVGPPADGATARPGNAAATTSEDADEPVPDPEW